MFDFHIHSRVSFDGHDTGETLAKAALARGLKEICFTDHLDYDPLDQMGCLAFDTAAYNAEYDNLNVPGLTIRRGMEFGMTVENVRKEMDALLPGKEQRKIMMDNYDEMVRRLGETGAPAKAAQMIYSCLMNK